VKYYFSGFILLLLLGCDNSPHLSHLNETARVLAFGDSLTYGTGATKGQSYPAVLEGMLGRQVINAGIPGELSVQGLARLPALLDKYQPRLLILCHGGNDILRKRDLDQMAVNLSAMINLARERGIEVIMLGVPGFGLFLTSVTQYKTVAEKTGIVFVADVLADILADKSLKADVVHPNNAGYREMAGQIYLALQDAGAVD